MARLSYLFLISIFLTEVLCNNIPLNKSLKYNSLETSVQTNFDSLNESFLTNIHSTNLKSKFYTIKTKNLNNTIDGLIKLKRNNTKEDQILNSVVNNDNQNCDLCKSSFNDTKLSCNQTCNTNYFKCLNQKIKSPKVLLIEEKFYCDKICDCEDCSDEIDCFLLKCNNANEILCQDKSSCIETSKVCDGVINCKDYSDELGCFDSRGCFASGRFPCDQNLCIEHTYICNGFNDCPNGIDEQNCACNSSEFFTCFNGQCINQNLRCDSIKNCLDGSDEWSCVLIDERDIVLKILPGLNQHGVLCADSNFSSNDADEICRLVGKEAALDFSQIEIELENGTKWVNKISIWPNDEKEFLKELNETFFCKESLAQTVTCKTYNCSINYNDNYKDSSNRQIGTPKEIESMVKLHLNFSEPINITKNIECTAQIISPIWLLSSYSCLNKLLISSNSNLNLINLNLSHTQKLSSKIKEVFLNSRSSKYKSNFIRNYDLALIKLDKPIVFEEKNANAICLPSREILYDITCFMTNFVDLEPIPFLVIDRERCNDYHHFNGTVFKDNICTIKQKDGEEEKVQNLNLKQYAFNKTKFNNHNKFSLGSPLICLNSDSKWFISGFLNYYDDRENLEHPAVFSNVYRMLDFILKVTGIGQL